MNTGINKTIIYGLGILAIMTFGAITMPSDANADSNTGGYVNAYNRFGQSDMGVNTGGQFNPGAPAPAPAPTNSVMIVRTATPIVYSSTVNKTKSTAVAQAAPTQIMNVPSTQTQTASIVTAQNSFMPSGILGWILLAILILAIVILARKVFGADKNYPATPMEHA